jgi:BirA family biotin operon repressor/biotin-[acetyl-CoA-carboxylase] ligase
MTVSPAETLRLRLAGRGVSWEADIHYVDVLGSTNDWLRDAFRRGARQWSVAWAGRQTAGRGRQGRSWCSPRGGLYASVLVDAPAALDPARPGPIAMLAGVSVASALAELGLDARLKWPNDVRVSGRKIAGVLVEAVAQGPRRSFILGLGVNCSVAREDLPTGLGTDATSVATETGRPCDVVTVCAAVLSQLGVCYDALATQGPAAVVQEWRRLSEPWWGREVEVAVGTERWRGTVLEVQDDGALWLERPGVGRVAIYSGDVSQLRLAGEERDGDGRA